MISRNHLELPFHYYCFFLVIKFHYYCEDDNSAFARLFYMNKLALLSVFVKFNMLKFLWCQVNNYALTMHLKQAQQSSSIPGRFNPDVF